MNEDAEAAFGSTSGTEAGDAFGQPSGERRSPPDRRKEDYDALDKKLDERFAELDAKIDERFGGLTKRLARFIAKALAGFAILGISSAIGLAGFGIVLSRESNNTTKIQNQRKASVKRTCDDQNYRHDKTSDALIKGAAVDESMRKTEAAKKEVRRRRDVTLGLINALAPKQNCKALVARAVKEEDQ